MAGFIPDDPDRNLESTSNLFNCQFYDDATKKITVNSPECVAWFNWYKKWYDTYNKKNALINLISTRTGGDAGLMQTGQLAMAIYGEWENGAAYLSTNAPNLHYDTAPIPAISPDKYGAAFINGNAWFIPTGSTNPEAAAKFGMYLMTDDPSRTMDIQNASVPQLTSLLTDPVLTAIPHQKTFLSLVNHKDAWTTPMISVYGQLKDGLGSALSAVTTGGADPQKALDDLAKRPPGQARRERAVAVDRRSFLVNLSAPPPDPTDPAADPFVPRGATSRAKLASLLSFREPGDRARIGRDGTARWLRLRATRVRGGGRRQGPGVADPARPGRRSVPGGPLRPLAWRTARDRRQRAHGRTLLPAEPVRPAPGARRLRHAVHGHADLRRPRTTPKRAPPPRRTSGTARR